MLKGRAGTLHSDCILSSAWRRSPEAGEREERAVTRRERTDAQLGWASGNLGPLQAQTPDQRFSLLPEPRPRGPGELA